MEKGFGQLNQNTFRIYKKYTKKNIGRPLCLLRVHMGGQGMGCR